MERNIFQTLDVLQNDSESEMSEEADVSGDDEDWQPPTERVDDKNDSSSPSDSESEDESAALSHSSHSVPTIFKMAVRLFLSFAILTLTLRTTSGQLSLPKRPLGFYYGGSAQRTCVEVVAYLDPTCPDSKAVYPTLLQVAQNYKPSQVLLRVHLFPLPYHRNSHTLAKAAHVLDIYSPNKNTAFSWLSAGFDNIEQLSTSGSANYNDKQVLDIISNMATNVTGIASQDFLQMIGNTSVDQNTRLDFKYGCTRGVYGTPMFTINDVFVDASSWTFQQWKTSLDKLLRM